MNAAWYSLKEYLIQQSGQVALLVLMVAGLSWLLRNRSAHVRYLLWLVVLAKCLVPPVMTVPLAVLPAEQVIMAEPISVVSDPVPAPVVPMNDTPIVTVTQPTFLELLTQYWLVALWMGGAAAFGLGMILRAGVFHRHLLRERVPAPASLMEELVDLQAQFGGHRSIRAWLTPQASQPFVWGRWRGQVYLPKNFMDQTNAAQRQSILAHELAHILRGDPLVNLIQIIVQALFWFHPLLWWANLQIRREREKCCDEMAIAVLDADVKDYCNTIVDVLVQQCPKRLPLGSVAIAGPVRNIEERIKTLMNPNKHFSKKAGSLSVLSIVLFALVVTSVSLGITEQETAVSFQTDTNQRIDLILSEQLLQDLSSALCEYSDDHDKQLPANLDEFNGSSTDSYYYSRYGMPYSNEKDVKNLTYPYLAKQWTLKPDYPVAFDNRLLQAYGGTYVLMSDGTIPYLTLEQMSKWELDQIEVLQESAESAETDRIKSVVSKIQSGDKLSRFGKIMLRYVNDQDNPFTKFSQLKGWGDDEAIEWAQKNVLLFDEPIEQGVIAYDFVLLSQQGQGTNVLYLDGQIEYANLDRLRALEVWEPQGQTVTTLDLISVPVENDVMSPFVGEYPTPRGKLMKLIGDTPGCEVIARPKALQNIGMTTTIEGGSLEDESGSMSFTLVSHMGDNREVYTCLEATLSYYIDEERITRRTYSLDILTRSNESYLLDMRQKDNKHLYLLITVELILPDDLKHSSQ